MKALESSYNQEDFTCQLSDVLDALKGTDVNFEIVKAQTVRPLKLEYVHNKARILKAFVFAWTELNDYAKWKSYGKMVEEISKKVKQQLQDKDALGIDDG